MPPQLNIVDALRARLPQLPRYVPRGVVVDVRGNTSTLDYEPIKVWRDSSVDYFLCAEKTIGQLESVKSFQSQRQKEAAGLQVDLEASDPTLLDNWSPASTTAYLHNESDVSHASSGALIDLVTLLLQRLVPKLEIRHRYESPANDSRRDLLWLYKRPDALDGDEGEEDQKWQEFAILEYKKTNVIHQQHFARGHLGVVENPRKPGVLLSLEQLLSQATKQEFGTLLTGNAVILTQQAVKYSDRAKYIILFDWDTMAVFGFTEESPEIAEIFFFQEDEVPESSGKTFRTLLLGFLQHSLEDTLKENDFRLADYLHPAAVQSRPR